MSKYENSSVSNKVPVSPSETQYNRYNMTLPRSFSVYNDEGSVIYRGEVEQVANQLRAELFGYGKVAPVVEQPVVKEEQPVVVKGYTKKRGFFLVLALILAAIAVAIAVIGLFETEINEYIALYSYQYAVKQEIVFLDPVFSFMKTNFDLDLGSLPAHFASFSAVSQDDTLATIAQYALPVSIVLYFVFAVISLLVSIVGLAGKKREDGTYRKVKLGFLSIVMLVCAALTLVGGLFMIGGSISDIGSFFMGDGMLTAGYGFYALIAIPVLLFVCTCLAFGKQKENK